MNLENIQIPATMATPAVDFNATTGLISLKGRSIPEEPRTFYAPLIEWAEKYSIAPSQATEIHIALDYFNSSSRKWLLNFLRKLEAVKINGQVVGVNWYYEEDDDDLLMAGEDFRNIINIPFKIIEVSA